MSRFLKRLFLLLLIASVSSIAQDLNSKKEHNLVCRKPGIEGMRHEWIKSIHGIVGENTKDISKINLFVSRYDGTTYVQSNFLSEDPEQPGVYSPYPTKVLANIETLDDALRNVIFWGPPPPNAAEVIEQARKSINITVDRSAIDQNGRIGIDLGDVEKIFLGTDKQTLASGKIETLSLKKPPPALVEAIHGCCLKGRPPGRSMQIAENLKKRNFDASKFSLLSMVIDSTTESIIAESKTLSSAQERAKVRSDKPWADQLSSAFRSAKGGTLVLLTHINKGNVEVLDSAENTLFSVPLTEIKKKAIEEDVNLVLFGCDTASYVNEESIGIGVAGLYNTASAARRLEIAVDSSSNVFELLKAMATPDLVIVAYDEAGGNGFAGGSAFAKIEGTGLMSRVFRLLSIRDGGR